MKSFKYKVYLKGSNFDTIVTDEEAMYMKQWNFYTSKELKPQGWLKKQLTVQARGLGGNLHRVWRDVKNSAWIGGDAEGWERVPYWLDGFVPLAYLLEDQELIRIAKKYMDAIISFQKPDGWICPCSQEQIPYYDTWAVQLISKVLTVYYECSGDERVPEVIYKLLKNYYTLLSNGTIKLFDWGKYRWFECFIAINFLYKRYQEDWICKLGRLLKEQGIDYSKKVELWKRPLNKWTYDTHIVNLVMMLKSEAVSCDLLREVYMNQAEDFHDILERFNGTPVGLFTGDECLSGLSPIQGTELCAVAEQMYSYELLYAYTGDKVWEERLAMLAFNALPAATSDDMWAHQYVQMSNQISCKKFPGRSLFRTNNGEAHLFGLEPHFGCCTSNFNQAWPKLALSTFLYRDNTVLSAIPIPSELRTDTLTVTLNTNYPFENEFLYKVQTQEPFHLQVRVPSFAKNIKVNGSPIDNTEKLDFKFLENTDTEIRISFETEVCMVERPHQLRSIKYGSLIFSLPITYDKIMHEYTENGIVRKFPYCDYEYIGTSDWNYGYASNFFEIMRHPVGEIPFASDNPPISIKTEAQKIPWEYEDGFDSVCAKLPTSIFPIGGKETIELYLYGCAKLRMTELPVIPE